MFYMPPPVYTYSRFINVPSETNRTTRDTPYVYLGISYGDTDMEGGIGFHPAGRGIHKRGQEWSDPERNTPSVLQSLATLSEDRERKPLVSNRL